MNPAPQVKARKALCGTELIVDWSRLRASAKGSVNKFLTVKAREHFAIEGKSLSQAPRPVRLAVAFFLFGKGRDHTRPIANPSARTTVEFHDLRRELSSSCNPTGQNSRAQSAPEKIAKIEWPSDAPSKATEMCH